MARYNIYEKDGALFRGWAGSGCVHQVKGREGWKPYRGDRQAPVTFGDFLRTEDDQADASEAAESGGRRMQRAAE